jgi:hypothetical protein
MHHGGPRDLKKYLCATEHSVISKERMKEWMQVTHMWKHGNDIVLLQKPK